MPRTSSIRRWITPETDAAGRLSRLFAVVAALSMMLALTATSVASAPIVSTKTGEVPTFGGLRPGPVGVIPPPVVRRAGVVPIAIRIDKAQVDAQVEQVQIVNGVMQDPTGPFVVSWYKETSELGEPGNSVMAGHLDYWDVGPAVFYHLGDLAKGDEIDVTGKDGKVYKYQVQWAKLYPADNAPIQEIVGRTADESLTLITCGGTFNYDTGHYLNRQVVRAVRIKG